MHNSRIIPQTLHRLRCMAKYTKSNYSVRRVILFVIIKTNDLCHFRVYRYIAYRRLARWIWHRLPKRQRKVLPACTVSAKRQQFPSKNYVGFKYAPRDLQLKLDLWFCIANSFDTFFAELDNGGGDWSTASASFFIACESSS